jgi:hypothetical protein
VFGVIELRQRDPLLDVRLFRDPTFTTGTAAITVFFLAMFGFFFLAMQYIQLVMGYDAIKTALSSTPLTGPMLLLSFQPCRSGRHPGWVCDWWCWSACCSCPPAS